MQQLIRGRFILFAQLLVLFSAFNSFAQTHTPKPDAAIGTKCNGYYEYLPEGYDPNGTATYPVIFFLTGIGEMGNGNTELNKVLVHEIPKLIQNGTFPKSFIVNGQTHRFIIITPQFKQGSYPTAADVNGVINYILPKYKINTNRIYLTGISYGGGLCWAYPGYNSTYADRIAAIVPIASPPPKVPSGQTQDQVIYTRSRNIAGGNIAVWALQNRTDNANPVTVPQSYVNYINEAPAPTPAAKITIFEQSGHTNTWPKAYNPAFRENGYNVYEWMLLHQNNAAPSTGGSKNINVNLYGGTNPYNNTAWNNWNVSSSLNSGTLQFSDASASSITAALSKNTISDNGSTYGSGMAPAEVLRYTSNATTARTLTLSGLSTGKTYSIELYASRNNTGNSTVFTAGGTQVTILTDKNKNNKALFTGLISSSGKIVVNIQNLNGYNYLNGFVLTENGSGVPTANAGSDKNITLPTNSVTLNGSGADPDGSIASYDWSKISGPSSFTISNSAVASPTVSNLAQGTYIFRLAVTDNAGDVDTDDVEIVVNSAPSTGEGNKQLKVNLFGGTNPYSNAEWNNWNVSSSLNSGTLKYSDASTSSVSAAISGHTLSDNGATYGGTMAPAEVLRYTSYSTAARTLTFSGLSSSKAYNLELYASRANTGNSTVFTAGGTSVTILTDNNKTNKASFTNLTADGAGRLVVNIVDANTYNYLNGFILTEADAPPPPSGTKYVKANLFGGTNPYSNAEWNNWNVSSSLNSGTLKYSDASTSSVSAAISGHTLSDNGATYGGTMAPAEVLRYTSYSTAARTLTFSGLSSSKAYNLELYASRANTGNSTVFTAGGTSVTILTDNNKTNKASFTSLTADGAGKLVVNIVDANTYNYLNGFILTENSEQATTVVPSALGAGEVSTLQAAVISDNTSGKWGVKAFPNPTQQSFTLLLNGSSNMPVQLRVFDASGRIVEQRQNIAVNNTISLGANYKAGTYYAEVIQGEKKIISKLIKKR